MLNAHEKISLPLQVYNNTSREHFSAHLYYNPKPSSNHGKKAAHLLSNSLFLQTHSVLVKNLIDKAPFI